MNRYVYLYSLEQNIKMEKRLNTKVEGYVTSFKNDIRNKIISLKLNENSEVGALLEYIYDYDRLTLEKNDFVKRKRVKNSIPENNRCLAKRANGEQCTRRRKDVDFCGTHSKGTPHGLLTQMKNSNIIIIQLKYMHKILRVLYIILISITMFIILKKLCQINKIQGLLPSGKSTVIFIPFLI